ncbi:hypothetical protein Moror_12059 [Moniliophthora roreri MCA 2997]|uniref:F-box domain-containing protein n=1 Tax=Moniliophthora roreri (strain MCA 2997) TaxID=1381753 RepID=V2W9W3_MONRO|nr:hypothetical protein Moror_12059 [Moniliophthora roreri MCA 2997]
MDRASLFKSSSTTGLLPAIEGHSRIPLSPCDEAIVLQYLRGTQEEMRTCEAEMMRLIEGIIELEKKRRGLQKSVDQYHSLLNPLHKIPTEILSSIFMFCCEKNELSVRSKLPPVMALSTVCGRWRDIILSDPALWASLSILTDHEHSVISDAWLLPVIELFMQRSKQSPISLDLVLTDPLDSAISIFTLVAEHSIRWSDVKFKMPRAVFEHEATRVISGHIPMLKQIQLSDDYDFGESGPDVFAVAPALSSFDCHPLYCQGIALPWEQLKVLTLRNAFPKHALSMLSRCSNLEQLNLYAVGGRYDEAEELGEPLTLHGVQSMTIVALGLDDCDTSFAFRLLTLPRLSSIDLSPSERYAAWSSNDPDEVLLHIKAFLIRSRCNITSLRIQVPQLDDRQVISILLLLPTLETLYIHEPSASNWQSNKIVTPLFLQRFTDSPPDSSSGAPDLLLPQLLDITLVVYGEELDTDCLSEAIMSRLQPASNTGIRSLRSISISIIGGDSNCLEKLSIMERRATAGCRVRILHTAGSGTV